MNNSVCMRYFSDFYNNMFQMCFDFSFTSFFDDKFYSKLISSLCFQYMQFYKYISHFAIFCLLNQLSRLF